MNSYFNDLVKPLTIFWKATGINISILDQEGQTLRTIGEPCEFCRLIRQEPELCRTCRKAHRESGYFSNELGDSYIFCCHAGLVLISLGLLRKGKHMGCILAGPLLLEYPDNDLLDQLIETCGLPSGCRSLYFEAIKAIPLVPPEQTYYLGQLLANLVYPAFAPSDAESLERRRKITLQQDMISEAIQEQSRAEDLFHLQEQQERALVECILEDNVEKAGQVLNDIFGRICILSGNEKELIKIRIGELTGVLLTNLLRRGTVDEEIMTPLTDCQQRIAEASDVDQIAYELQQILPLLISLRQKTLAMDVTEIVQKCLQYIRKHYRGHISLADAADSIGVSHSHLSRVFKDEMGMGFSDYVNEYRMDRARELLSISNMSISEIAMSVGYSNQQYFTKVFKQHTGSTPGQFRKKI